MSQRNNAAPDGVHRTLTLFPRESLEPFSSEAKPQAPDSDACQQDADQYDGNPENRVCHI
jgi:hypothetical protein